MFQTLSAYHCNNAIEQRKKTWNFHEPCSLKFKFLPSLSPLLLYPAPQVHLTSFALRITEGPPLQAASHSPVAMCLDTSWHLSPITAPPQPMLLMERIIQHAQIFCMQSAHATIMQQVVVGGWWLKSATYPWSLTFYLTVLLMHNRGEKCWEEGWHVTNVPCSYSALIAGKYAVMQCWCRGGESYDSAQYIMILLGNFYISPIPFHWHSGGGSGGWLRAEIIALERRRMFLIQTESPLIAEPCKDPATIRELPH